MSSAIASTSTFSTFDIVILKWRDLEQMYYYKIDQLEFVSSRFHSVTVPIALINGVWYWMPESTFTFAKMLTRWNVSTPILIFAGGKMKYQESKHESWSVMFYFSYLSLMKKMYNDFEKSFCEFKNTLDTISHEDWTFEFNSMPTHATDINFNLFIRKCDIYKHLNLEKLYLTYLQVSDSKKLENIDPYKTPSKSILVNKSDAPKKRKRVLARTFSQGYDADVDEKFDDVSGQYRKKLSFADETVKPTTNDMKLCDIFKTQVGSYDADLTTPFPSPSQAQPIPSLMDIILENS